MENNASFNFIDLQAALTNAEFVNFKSEWTSCGLQIVVQFHKIIFL